MHTADRPTSIERRWMSLLLQRLFLCYTIGMALSWSERRKYTYSAAGGVIVLLVLWFLYNTFFSAPATCFDGVQNGSEQGVDCGGSCALLCPNQAHTPSVAWMRSFLTSTSTGSGQASADQGNIYTAAAYIQNQNLDSGARNAAYSFQLFDADNHLIIERDGTASLPPLPNIPIVETNIPTGSRTVARTLFAFSALPSWTKLAADSIPQIKVNNQQLSSDGSRLSLTLQNPTVHDAQNITVIGILYDANGSALAASKSLVPSLAHKASQDVVLTWPQSQPGTVRAEIIVLPSF